jgi:hypothetical protein
MQRIVKRFLLHSQRESDDNHERDFEELKQDLQMIRYEMLNDLKRSKEESYQSVSLIHAGLSIIGEEVFKNSTPDNLSRFSEYKSYGNEIKEMYQDEFLDPMDIGDDGDEHSQQDPTLHSGKKGRILRRKFKLINVVNKALQTGDVPIIFQSIALDQNKEIEEKKDEEEIMEENRQIISLFRNERHSGRSFAERRVTNSEDHHTDFTKSKEESPMNQEESKEMEIDKEKGSNRSIYGEENSTELAEEHEHEQENNQEMGFYRNDEDSDSSFDEEADNPHEYRKQLAIDEEVMQTHQEGDQNDEESHLNIEGERQEAHEHNAELRVDHEGNQEQENDQETGYYRNDDANSSPTGTGEHGEEQNPNLDLNPEENKENSDENGDPNSHKPTETVLEDIAEHETQKDDQVDENQETKAQNNDSYYFF